MKTLLPSPRRFDVRRCATLAAVTTLLATGGGAAWAQSGKGLEVYSKVGFPGLLLGLGVPVAERVSLRADIGGIGKLEDTYNEKGIEYQGALKATRIGLFGDWFPFGGAFRLTGGVTVNDMKLDLTAKGAGRVLEIGNNRYTLTTDDRFEVRGELPSTTPYLGIGWGHQPSNTGWGFHADLGMSFGKAKVSARAVGPLAQQPGIQADIDREIQEVKDAADSVRVIPQITVGVSYRF